MAIPEKGYAIEAGSGSTRSDIDAFEALDDAELRWSDFSC